jgi:hypothetical protein
MLILVDLLLIMIKFTNYLPALLLVIACLAQGSEGIPDASQIANDVAQMDGPLLAEEAKADEEIREKLPSFIIDEFK